MAADRNITNLSNLHMISMSATRSGENFFPPGCATAQTRFGNVYYHSNIPCIQAKCPYFTSDMLEVIDGFMAVQPLPINTEYLTTHMDRQNV